MPIYSAPGSTYLLESKEIFKKIKIYFAIKDRG